jgi:hypothetical protein
LGSKTPILWKEDEKEQLKTPSKYYPLEWLGILLLQEVQSKQMNKGKNPLHESLLKYTQNG